MHEGSTLAGKFRLVSLLGRGGMGEVWRADHLGLRAPVAVKLMKLEIAANPEALARFHREAQSAANLRSPHVVQILDHGVDEATKWPFIVMELLEGESLSQRLTRCQRLSPAETARHVTHIARALSRAHEVGIVHRDLKPDNVFVVHNEDDEIAKVLDFGVAKWTLSGNATQTGSVLGTPYYMSPEQISDSKDIDHRTDLWALGVITCQCLTGRRPFQAENVVALGMQICGGPRVTASSLGAVPHGFDAWFERATARDANTRFQSARELADELRLLCADHRTPAASGSGGNAPAAVKTAPTVTVTHPTSVEAAEARAGAARPQRMVTEAFQESVGPLSRTAPSVLETGSRRRRSSWWIAAAIVLVTALGALGRALFAGRAHVAKPEASSGGEAEVTRDERARVHVPTIAAGVAAGRSVESAVTSAPRVTIVPTETETEADEVPATPKPAPDAVTPEPAPRSKAAPSVPIAGASAGDVASPRPKAPASTRLPSVDDDARRSGSLMDTRK
jgi:eukaryotic-like serine/threonine-protein kinase